MFIVVSTTPGAFMQSAHFVGTAAQCRVYQLAQGLRAVSKIIPL